jgi:Fic family protein
VKDAERPFFLRPHHLLRLNAAALEGIHVFAGTFRNGPVHITKSSHVPPDSWLVSEEVNRLCEYVNENFATSSAEHLGAYVLWRANWIHPFADGNGRTARVASYMVMSIKLDSLLPGRPTIPDQIASNKTPYYDGLEQADKAWKDNNKLDLAALELMLDSMLAKQLLSAVHEASG